VLFSSALIGLREGLEAALVVSILVAFLVNTDRRHALRRVWPRVGTAVLLSVAVGAILTFTTAQLTFQHQELLGGGLSVIAVVFVTAMIFWMRKASRSIAAELRGKLDQALDVGPLAVVLLSFLAVGREGLETSVFFYSAAQTAQQGTTQPLIGFGIGIERVLIACDAEGVLPTPAPHLDAFVVDAVGPEAGAEVTALLAERFPVSLQLAAAAMLFALFVSIPLGVIAALRRNSWIDYLCTGYTVLGFAVPNFGLALILIYVFSIKLDWLPITGIGSSEAAAGGWWTYIRPFIVPAVALGTLQTAMLTRLLRSSMIDVLSQDYMRTARAKGLLPSTIVIVHALKNAMIPFITMVAVQFGYMIGIQVTIEYIFAVPGMGSAVLNAVVTRDFPVIQGFTLVISAFFLFANIVADMLYALLDPRIRY